MENMMCDPSDFQKLNDEVFDQLVEAVFHFLIEGKTVELLMTRSEKLAEKHGIASDTLKNMLQVLISFTSNSVKQGHSSDELQQKLQNIGFSESKIAIYVGKWKTRSSDLAKTVLHQGLSMNRLADIEWKFGVTAASSESNRIGSTFIQLKLVVDKGDGLENVYMELTLPQFYAFLHEMERAKASMGCLTQAT